MDGPQSETNSTGYDANMLKYSIPHGAFQNGLYPDYSEWHQNGMESNRQQDVAQYPPFMGYSTITHGEIGGYWSSDMAMHAGVGPFSAFPPSRDSMQSINSYTTGQTLGKNGKPKRKRVQSAPQRRAANIRERRRMFHLNEAFDSLRKRLPAFNYEKRLSRIETLRLAMTYISFMKAISEGEDPHKIRLKPCKQEDENIFKEMQDNFNLSEDSESA